MKTDPDIAGPALMVMDDDVFHRVGWAALRRLQ